MKTSSCVGLRPTATDQTCASGQTRREFIEALVAAGLGLIAGRVQAQESGQLVSYFKDIAAAKSIGEEYLRAFPDERDIERLPQLIMENSITWSGSLIGMLAQMIRNDFGASRTVKIHGWILARTEARICALAAISAPA